MHNNKIITLRPTHIVGIGASAGGLEALEKFFRAMPVDSGMAFVVIRHLSPDFKSLMGEQLERYTTMPVISVMEREIVAANTIYLLPPKKDMVIEGDELLCTDRPTDRVLRLPINTFFRSLATAWGEKAVAIVLSGTGSDGSTGIIDVHESGGLVFVQNEESSGFDGMPHSAIATGCVDVILNPQEMPTALKLYTQNPAIKFDYPLSPKNTTHEAGIPAIFECLQTTYGIDFNFYKPQTIMRRIERRIALHPEHISIEEYSQRVQNDRAELDLLYKDLLIGVTRFFRDPEAFEVLHQKVIPSILQARVNDENEVRVWVCGCSTGEEAYSIAILFLEAFEDLGKEPRLKILATDLHRESLRFAAEGVYLPSSFPKLPEPLREKYFICQADGRYKVIANLRKTLIFSEHNVLKDPPFTRIDLVSCRNLLIYLQNPAQMRVIAFFHFALKLNGYLMLGASEGLGELANQFRTEDQHWKVFVKTHEDRLITDLRAPLIYTPRAGHHAGAKELRIGRVYDALLTRFIPSGILVNNQQEAVHIFGNAARYLCQPTGRVSTELSAIAEGKLRIALMTALRNAEQRKTKISLKGIRFSQGDIDCYLNITVEPLPENTNNTEYYIILLAEQVFDTGDADSVSTSTSVVEIDGQATTQIHYLEIELQQTRDSLQSTVEELETINEELQAANEELLASNEELQSTNEELHSVNEELYSVNAEHEQKICELNKVSSNLNNLIYSTDFATVFLDNEGLIQLFTPKAVEIFALMPHDIGRNLRHFHSLCSDESLYADIDAVFAGQSVMEKQLAWDNERTLLRRITSYRDVNKKVAGLTLTYIDISDITKVQQALQVTENQFRLLAENTSDWIFITDENFQTIYNSPACIGITGYSSEDISSTPDFLKTILCPDYLASYNVILNNTSANCDLDMKIIHRDGAERWIVYNSKTFYNETGVLLGCCGSIRNITERKKIETELRITATAFESQECIVITDANNIIIRVNKSFTDMTGYTAAEVIGKNPRILSSGYQNSDFYAVMWNRIHCAGSWEGELWNKRKNGEIYPERLLITAVKNTEGLITNYVGSFKDISKSREAEDKIEKLAFYDTLTHLPNRSLLLERLQRALIASEHNDKIGAVLFIDLDNFKILNDTQGHDFGDMLLQEVAVRLQSCVRESDTVARLGGDEFVVILTDLSASLHEAEIQIQLIANKIKTAINRPYQLVSYEHSTTGSIGITMFEDHAVKKEDLLKQADIAMYEAKSAGRNTVCFFTPTMQAAINARVSEELALQQALTKEQFVLYYQSQNTVEGKIVSAEVLIRWQHPETGLILPANFIHLAERTGMIMPIGQWVLEKACAQLKAWENNPLANHLVLAVNVSAKQFHQPDFVEQVCQVLSRTNVKPDKLVLELTESVVLDDVNDTIIKMNILRKLGVHFSMDDFGTGYSSLLNLKRLPINELKIDYSFVRDLVVDSDDAAIVQTIIAMARNLGLKVVAEGVETEEQRVFLEQHGCLIYQGYLFSKPVPIDEFEALLLMDSTHP
jgi:two-component system CheB/CheR fusion protein